MYDVFQGSKEYEKATYGVVVSMRVDGVSTEYHFRCRSNQEVSLCFVYYRRGTTGEAFSARRLLLSTPVICMLRTSATFTVYLKCFLSVNPRTENPRRMIQAATRIAIRSMTIPTITPVSLFPIPDF